MVIAISAHPSFVLFVPVVAPEMSFSIPELVRKSAAKTLQEFCLEPLLRSGHAYFFAAEAIPDGFELSVALTGHQPISLARLRFSPELAQWTLHRPRSENRWSYVPEAGGSLDLGKLLRYVQDDPLNVFWS